MTNRLVKLEAFQNVLKKSSQAILGTGKDRWWHGCNRVVRETISNGEDPEGVTGGGSWQSG